MQWASAVADADKLDVAIARASAELGDLADKPDLLVAFITPHHDQLGRDLAARLRDAVDPGVLVGCSAAAVIGAGCELEGSPGVALLAARLPNASVHLSWVPPQPPDDDDEAGWRELIGEEQRGYVMFADPFSLDAQHLGQILDRYAPGAPVVGGLASGGTQLGESVVLAHDRVERSGAALLGFGGDVAFDALVAQSCRPVGRAHFVTASRGNIIDQIDGRPAALVLRELFEGLSGRDAELFRTSLFIGTAMREKTDTYELGDFLLRNLVGVDPNSGALAIGAPIEPYTVIQFHLRDPATSANELEALLSRYAEQAPTPVAAALLFSCLGRGVSLYGEPNHDSRALASKVGPVPTAGLFCSGEIGPVNGATYLHGYTSVFGLLRQRHSSDDG